MKLYRIKSGTKGKVIDRKETSIKDWTVTKDLNFMDTVADPIRYHNRPADITDPLHVKLVQQGYALFVDPKTPRYILAVQYEDVGVLA